jgi:exosome complex RNA-binding protein Rrp42 (RNase PH superfamily)
MDSTTTTTTTNNNYPSNTDKYEGRHHNPSSITSTLEQSVPSNMSTLPEWLGVSTTTNNNNNHMQSLDTQQYLLDYWQQYTRPDGRLFAQGRPCKVVRGIVKEHAVGSALVNVTTESLLSSSLSSSITTGNNNNNNNQTSSSRSTSSSKNYNSNCSSTKILAATTIQIGQPSPEQPHRGDIVVHVSGTGGKNLGMDFFSGGGNQKSKQQQQQHSWDVLQTWLQRVLEEEDAVVDDDDCNNGVDGRNGSTNKRSIPSQLLLVTGKAALRLIMSVHIIEDGGNVMDAALLACMAAWKDTTLPQVGKDLVEVQGVWYWKKKKKDGLSPVVDEPKPTDRHHHPSHQQQRLFRTSLTMGIWQHPKHHTTHLLVDPSKKEESCLNGKLTIVVVVMNGRISKPTFQVQYTGTVALTGYDLAVASKLAQARAEELGTILS